MEYLYITIVGIALGITINYFSDILPGPTKSLTPSCATCKHPLSVKDYLFRMCCSQCGTKRPAKFYIVIITTLVISCLMYFFPPYRLGFWAALPVLAFLGVVFVIDVEHRVVLFETTVFGFVLFLVYGFLFHSWKTVLFGFLGGLGITLLFYFFGILVSKLVSIIQKKTVTEVAFGLGDVMAATVFGLLVGWPAIAGVIIIAIVSFALVSVITLILLIATKKYSAFSNALPFVPFLILGVIVVYYL